MSYKPFIARDTKQPLEVLGGYKIKEGGEIHRDKLPSADLSDFEPTHHDTLLNKKVMAKKTAHGYHLTWEHGMSGGHPGELPERYKPLSSSQHSESEQFGEENYPIVLKKHGYKRIGRRNVYEHPELHTTVHISQHKGIPFWSHHNPVGNPIQSGVFANTLDSHLSKYHGSSQHSEESQEETLSITLHGAPGSFGPAILTKPVKEQVTQHAEMLQGRSNFLAQRGRRFRERLHKILLQHGGAVHNKEGGFTLPKRAAESFNHAASDAGFHHGQHYLLG